MLTGIAYIVGFQLLGETLVRIAGLPVPGPVLGMALLFIMLVARPRTAEAVGPPARGILSVLSLLFVPASIGVTGHLDLLADRGLTILAILAVSVVAAMLASVWAFVAVEKLVKQ